LASGADTMSNLPATISTRETKQDKVVFVFNFFDELRRLALAVK
jgi:hypothetical protein